MALTNKNLIRLEGLADFRKIAAFEFTKAYQAIHRNIPFQEAEETDETYNARVDAYLKQISVESKLERSIEADGKLNIWPTKNLLAALSTYNIEAYEGDDDTELINSVINYKETAESPRAIIVEATKLLKGYSFRPAKVEIEQPD